MNQRPIEVADAAEMAARFAELVLTAAARAIGERGGFHWVLTGGSSARLYDALGADALDWSRVHLYWGDERAVPAAHPDSNAGAAAAAIARWRVPAGQVHRMPADMGDLAAAAASYDRVVRDAGGFDLVHLGVGPDGHVCSLFPGHAAMRETRAWVVAVTDSPKPPPRRLTLTLPALLHARRLVATCAGADKARAFAAAHDPASALPVALVARGPAPFDWIVDAAVRCGHS
jgi:6-phosphogluconolactonase